jgi:hypothetical protein
LRLQETTLLEVHTPRGSYCLPVSIRARWEERQELAMSLPSDATRLRLSTSKGLVALLDLTESPYDALAEPPSYSLRLETE